MRLNKDPRQAFLPSAREVLETMFFVGVLGEQPRAESCELVCAELQFHGTLSGHFGVGVSPSTGKLITANFLGKDGDSVMDPEIAQVVAELSNMICGSVLSRIAPQERLELTHPEIVPSCAHTDAVSSNFELEEGSIALWMTLGANTVTPVEPAAQVPAILGRN